MGKDLTLQYISDTLAPKVQVQLNATVFWGGGGGGGGGGVGILRFLTSVQKI